MTTFETPRLRALIDAVSTAVIEAAGELTTLDQAIGDGDHGLNMKRGFEAVSAQIDAIADKPLPEALRTIGTTLIMKVGGASGPLYGTLLTTLGKTLGPEPSLAELANALEQAIAAIRRLGKADAGMKTMLDVLMPVQAELAREGADPARRVCEAAAAGAEATIPMKAIRGRASFLGDRSIGHLDPGARSSSLIVATVCEVLSR